jgi:hypothetical protein
MTRNIFNILDGLVIQKITGDIHQFRYFYWLCELPFVSGIQLTVFKMEGNISQVFVLPTIAPFKFLNAQYCSLEVGI